MSNITLHTSHPTGFTIIPNYFLDNYMSQANGEFVKIYLYLLRATQLPEFSLSTIADSMNCTEKDVLRALRYWAKEGLLALDFDGSRKLKRISFLEPSADMVSRTAVPQSNRPELSTVTGSDKTDSADKVTDAACSGDVSANAGNFNTAVTGTVDSDMAVSGKSFSNAEPVGFHDPTETLKSGPASAQTAAAAEKPVSSRKNTLTADKIRQLKENEDITQLLFIAEQYLGKTLSPMETGKILYFYDELNFSTDLIEYLIEYCVGNNHRSMNYIEKVALNWKSEGISTVEAAKKTSSGYQKEYYTIFKALGIRNRSPIDAEINAMKKWLNDFSMELIVEACTRTILTTKQPELSYVNGILESWKHAGARTIQDVRKLDTAHEQAKAEKKTRRNPKPASTKFSNFNQRAYDFDSLESQLLNQ